MMARRFCDDLSQTRQSSGTDGNSNTHVHGTAWESFRIESHSKKRVQFFDSFSENKRSIL